MTEKPIRNQFADTMLDVGVQDPDLVVMVGDISHFILQPFAEACPGRYYNIGICEPTMLSMAAGLSKMGFHPVVHTIAPFIIERSFEQIKLDFCYQRLSGNLITVGSVFDYANLGCTHHCYGDFALLKTLPHTQIVYPADAVEFDTLFRQAYANDRLTLYRIPGAQHGVAFEAGEIRFGEAIKVKDGSDITVIATGPHLKTALDAAKPLSEAGWDAEILYLHTLLPLDEERILASLKKTKCVVTIEEHMERGGLGDDILRLAAASSTEVRSASLSIPNRFTTKYGTYEDHCRELGFTPEGLVDLIRNRFENQR